MGRSKRDRPTPPLTGVGPLMGAKCPTIAVSAAPLISVDEWNLYGRPNWVLVFNAGTGQIAAARYYAKTLVPAHMELQIIAIVPVNCIEILAGAKFGRGPLYRPVAWEECKQIEDTRERIKRGAMYGPRVVTYSPTLTAETAQTYALPADETRKTPAPQIGLDKWPDGLSADEFERDGPP